MDLIPSTSIKGTKNAASVTPETTLRHGSYTWKTEHQSDSNSAKSWTPKPWKASLHPAMLHAVSPRQLVPKLLA
jgi:hypothetical protein